ncbi:hypothetical protein ACK8HH_17255 [Gordonia sp. LUNF6]|uniref:hypothetical protein n=1 Tax=Gordonia sp. LUNF6 TaxID=3388658 RepID=UPI003999D28C
MVPARHLGRTSGRRSSQRARNLLMFTLVDLENVLEPETYRTISQALDRATKYAIWAGRPWQITDPTGRPAYSARYPKGT